MVAWVGRWLRLLTYLPAPAWLQERQVGARMDDPYRWQAQAQGAEAAALARLKDEEARRLEVVTAQRVAEEARMKQLEEQKRKDLQAYQVRPSPS